MRVQIDVSQLNAMNTYRGVGVYTDLLFQHLRHLKTLDTFSLTTEKTKEHPDLIHYPYFDVFFHTLPIKKRAKTVVTIHDVIPLVFPEHYRSGIKGSVRFLQQLLALNTVDAVITDSMCSKKDIIQHLKFPAEKIYVVHLAGNPLLHATSPNDVHTVLNKYSIPEKYLLYVGDINYNKNLPALLRAFSTLSQNLHLVMVGRSLNNIEIPEGRWIHDTIQEKGIAQRVHLLTDIPKHPATELATLFTGASAYVQPSLYEGFGLSVLDAMQCGTLVISSTGGSLPEVINDAALFFDPRNEHEMADTINQALSLSMTKKKIFLSLAQYNLKRFSWEKTAQKTYAIYKKVLETV
ncbi:MAG: hypothetical protein A2840_02530 [Candidatus Buchananbacteria bacterium RIFCSPHIGHO2_01_FULL_47_11b]|uniref:Glycosyl transferase family 1 domain-containing protein n=1 Tax=Candidatus Buchananbacteria bacterium RIFCSPHIGHO2_01_FULL_47_11b TaxID=1797537 RepID=A0A1G1Y1T6_9BACT|nr:MAG: hypothetical protein A2840_02530 [Candidatus Buchananbacteria bacterium RIFCSPHIGHO2_01_FULL_47_11b]